MNIEGHCYNCEKSSLFSPHCNTCHEPQSYNPNQGGIWKGCSSCGILTLYGKICDKCVFNNDEISLLKKQVANWKLRAQLATDFDQCEMDKRVCCSKCDIPFSEDYCSRDESGINICDICTLE